MLFHSDASVRILHSGFSANTDGREEIRADTGPNAVTSFNMLKASGRGLLRRLVSSAAVDERNSREYLLTFSSVVG